MTGAGPRGAGQSTRLSETESSPPASAPSTYSLRMRKSSTRPKTLRSCAAVAAGPVRLLTRRPARSSNLTEKNVHERPGC
ncbi:hypothetical protein SAMN00790413_04891 [Deinococcus hopiensis KR-140]|uniref:Uncharacterized protein n=1 Tax=Deinococcus hopiensis KR-140 TaxID=695939 RepID=A0A1W1UST0_9DEIO|nr:hypothetical protein SAMN00790413_04891 [Deinococcus hopiensis KR-140]